MSLPHPHRQWSSNICDCCIDFSTCCYAFACPCCAFVKISKHTLQDEEPGCCGNCGKCCSGCSRGLCCCLMPGSAFLRAPYRKQLRVRHNLPAKPCNDCCTVFWCPCCSLAQELREIEYQQKMHPPKVETMKA